MGRLFAGRNGNYRCFGPFLPRWPRGVAAAASVFLLLFLCAHLLAPTARAEPFTLQFGIDVGTQFADKSDDAKRGANLSPLPLLLGWTVEFYPFKNVGIGHRRSKLKNHLDYQ